MDGVFASITGGRDEFYLVATAPIGLNRRIVMNATSLSWIFIVFLRTKERRKKKLPEGSINLKEHGAFGFFTNVSRPSKDHANGPQIYSERWRQEHVIAQVARFNSGYYHKIGHRFNLFCTGFLIVAVYMLQRALDGVVRLFFDGNANDCIAF